MLPWWLANLLRLRPPRGKLLVKVWESRLNQELMNTNWPVIESLIRLHLKLTNLKIAVWNTYPRGNDHISHLGKRKIIDSKYLEISGYVNFQEGHKNQTEPVTWFHGQQWETKQLLNRPVEHGIFSHCVPLFLVHKMRWNHHLPNGTLLGAKGNYNPYTWPTKT